MPAQDSQGRYVAPDETLSTGVLASASRTTSTNGTAFDITEEAAMADEQNEVEEQVTEVDPGLWEEQPAVTGRPNDIGSEGPGSNSTFAERAAARNKQQKSATGKAAGESAKRPARRAAKKAG